MKQDEPTSERKEQANLWNRGRRYQIGNYLIVLCVVGLVVSTCVTLGNAWKIFRHMSASNRLKSIGLALHTYHDDYHCFPPISFNCKDGTSEHSWKALIYSRMVEEARRDNKQHGPEYRFSEPWDSPHNRSIASDWLGYQFLAVVGENAAWLRNGCRQFSEIVDGTDETALVLGIEADGYHVFEPIYLEFDGNRLWLDEKEIAPEQIRYIFTADGMVHFREKGLTAEQLKALCTINGGEELLWDL